MSMNDSTYLMGEVEDYINALSWLKSNYRDCKRIIHTGNLFKHLDTQMDFKDFINKLSEWLLLMNTKMVILRGGKDCLWQFNQDSYPNIELVQYKCISEDVLFLAGGSKPGNHNIDDNFDTRFKFSPHIFNDFKYVISHIPPIHVLDWEVHKEFSKTNTERYEMVSMYLTYNLLKKFNNHTSPNIWYFGKYDTGLEETHEGTIFRNIGMNYFEKMIY